MRRQYYLRAMACVCAVALMGDQALAEQASGQEESVIVTARVGTATKTDTPIVQTPQSISTVSADLISARGAIGVQEALRYTPGLRTEPNGGDYRFDYVLLRGFGSTDFIDGLREPDSSNFARVEPYTLDRIEVLRGPSSVLYGQAAPGGIVNQLSKVPQFRFGGEVAAQYGSFNRVQGQADITGALNGAGTLAGRFVGLVRDAGNQYDFGKDDRILAAPSLRFRSADAGTDLIVSGVYQRDRAASISAYLPVSATLLAPSPQRELHRRTYLGEPSHNFYNTITYSATAQLTQRLGEGISYSGRARYLHGDVLGMACRPVAPRAQHQCHSLGIVDLILHIDAQLRVAAVGISQLFRACALSARRCG